MPKSSISMEIGFQHTDGTTEGLLRGQEILVNISLIQLLNMCPGDTLSSTVQLYSHRIIKASGVR